MRSGTSRSSVSTATTIETVIHPAVQSRIAVTCRTLTSQRPIHIPLTKPPCDPMSQSMELQDRRPNVVIVGGGFGGIHAARALRGAPVRVTLVDRCNHPLFQPLLYQVATAA